MLDTTNPLTTNQSSMFNLPELVLVGNAEQQRMPPVTAVLQQSPGAEDPDEALYQTAKGLMNDSNYELAEPVLEKLSSSLELRLDANHPALAKVCNMLAVTYLAVEKYSLAETFAYRALTIWEKQEHTGQEIAKTLNNLASIYNCLGQYQDGELCLRRAFSTMEQLARKEPESVEDADLLPILENFCRLLKLTGRKAEADLLDARIHAGSQQRAA